MAEASTWRIHGRENTLFSEYMVLAERAGWGSIFDPSDQSIGCRDALIVVDLQNDNVPKDASNTEGGSFAVAEASSIVPLVTSLMNQFIAQGATVVATKDYHTKYHCSFISLGGPFPVHCVQGSSGSDFYRPIGNCLQELRHAWGHPKEDVKIAFKGIHQDVDSPGAFPYNEEGSLWPRITTRPKSLALQGRNLSDWTGAVLLQCSNLDTDVDAPPDVLATHESVSLHEFLQKKGIERIFVCGLPFDSCVLDTVVNAHDVGFKEVFLIIDASRATHLPGMGNVGSGFLTCLLEIKEHMRAAGAKFVPTASLLPGFSPNNPISEKDEIKHGFPHELGPFALVPAKKLALWINKTALSYRATAPSAEIHRLEEHGIEPEGSIAPIAKLTLSKEDAKKAGIPASATEFTWAYPVCGGSFKDQARAYFSIATPSAAFFIYGGFVYFDAKGSVVGTMAISLGEGLSFGAAEPWDSRYSWNLQKRWRPVTAPFIREKGSTFFTWLNPGETLEPDKTVGGTNFKAPAHGAFIYLFGKDPNTHHEQDRVFPIIASSRATTRRSSLRRASDIFEMEENDVRARLKVAIGSDTAQKLSIGKVAATFKRWGGKKDGRVSKDELKSALSELSPHMTSESLDRIFEEADVNKDGRVDVDEFVLWLYRGSL